MPERVGTTKWFVGEQVFWQDRDVAWTVQPGPCTAGAAFVHITRPGLSAVVWQDELVLADPFSRTTAQPALQGTDQGGRD